MTTGRPVHFLTQIPAELHHRAKIQAALEGTTLKQLVLRALAQAVAARQLEAQAGAADALMGAHQPVAPV
jgi:hypothetical protein